MDLIRLQQANQIIATYAPHCAFVAVRNSLYFAWQVAGEKEKRIKRWVPRTRGSDYPSIRTPFGGTCTRATMELYRWIRGGRIRPLGYWRFTCSKPVGMNPKAAELAASFGWPEQVPCVFCGRLLGNGVRYDHYDRKDHDAGPGCWYGQGCEMPK
jgi:hypothetical protein